ncbi:glutaminase A [Thiocapsa marina]|uniref:Glutaminase n=1 Tax=Thiocapsa marina 5811 TaxID=768671 RepID=F9UEB3_9GAMM|nr:glutaminase A [Thiocapsa marina]EGV17234.1 anti-sigma-factor antagonist [Thiocapsa marina 5811]
MDKRAFQFSPVQRYLDRIHEELLDLKDGAVADYIPELTRADPSWLGIAMVTVDGHVYQVGDSRQSFTIQSISKAITYGLALEDRGLDQVLSKVGVEPSGEAFNSISLEPGTGRPMNPMINAGAIATTGLIASTPDAPPMQRILDAFGRYTGRPMAIEETVYRSESDTGHRNRAIAHLLLGYGILDRTPEEVVDLYFRQCSILVTARDLAMIGACLANNGVNPVTGVVALQSRYVEKVLSVMSTCGMYDFSGAWIFNVGMPAKSGVGGGITAVLPGQFGLGVFSPRLDAKGNSVRGIEACKRLSKDFSLHLFHVARSTSATVMRQVYDCAKRTSRRRRSEAELAVLAEQGHRIRVYELQGELLFGSAESVGVEILSELARVDYLVLDLKRVIGTDQASILVLSELCMRIADAGKRLFFTDGKHLYRFRKHLQGQAYRGQEPGPLHFEDTDHAVEWCENQLIARADTAGADTSVADLSQQYLCAAMTHDELESLRRAGLEREFKTGERIFHAGDRAESMFFILSGEVEVWIDTGASLPLSHHLRLSSLGPGMVFGEVALVNEKRRTANVSAAMETRCLELRFDAIPDALLVKMLMSMASHFANKIERDTQLIQQLA